MKIIYKADSTQRAGEIHGQLLRHGIAAEVHGENTYRLFSRTSDAVSVWVRDDADFAKANAILHAFFVKEAEKAGAVYPPKPMNRKLKYALLVASGFFAFLIALTAAYGL